MTGRTSVNARSGGNRRRTLLLRELARALACLLAAPLHRRQAVAKQRFGCGKIHVARRVQINEADALGEDQGWNHCRNCHQEAAANGSGDRIAVTAAAAHHGPHQAHHACPGAIAAEHAQTMTYWNALSPAQQAQVEADALAGADAPLQESYRRSRGTPLEAMARRLIREERIKRLLGLAAAALVP